jgi:hypothetical protein
LTEEKPSDEIDFDSFPSSMLGDFRITVEKCTATYKKKVSNEELEKFMIEYEIHLKQIPRTIDEKISEKQGITHITELVNAQIMYLAAPELISFQEPAVAKIRVRGIHRHECKISTHSQTASSPPTAAVVKVRKKAYYLSRIYEANEVEAYISVKGYSLHKAPILLECYQWEALTEPERVSSFKILQVVYTCHNRPSIDQPILTDQKAYDKAHTLQQRIAEAGPGADKNAIQRELLELGEVPNRWRAWGNLYKREREGLFCELQVYSKVPFIGQWLT